MKTYTLPISEETSTYLQRLGYEVDTATSVIDRLFTNHKDDPDASVFESIPFKTYHKKMEESLFQYNLAKDELTKELQPIVAEKEGVSVDEVSFNWRIDDFLANEVIIEILDGNVSKKDFCVCSK